MAGVSQEPRDYGWDGAVRPAGVLPAQRFTARVASRAEVALRRSARHRSPRRCRCGRAATGRQSVGGLKRGWCGRSNPPGWHSPRTCATRPDWRPGRLSRSNLRSPALPPIGRSPGRRRTRRVAGALPRAQHGSHFPARVVCSLLTGCSLRHRTRRRPSRAWGGEGVIAYRL